MSDYKKDIEDTVISAAKVIAKAMEVLEKSGLDKKTLALMEEGFSLVFSMGVKKGHLEMEQTITKVKDLSVFDWRTTEEPKGDN